MSTKLDAIQFPGELHLQVAKIKTSTGLEIDLRKSILGITIFEDLFSSTISGTMVVQDAVNLASLGPIIGQEYLFLKIKTPSLTDLDSKIDFSENAFIVFDISGREDAGNGVQGYTLSFVSQELIKDQRTKIKQSLTDSWSKIVERILVNKLETKKKIVIEPTTGVKKFISPNLRPFELIRLATRQAISRDEGKSMFVFYESLKGFNFRSLSSLYSVGSKFSYDDHDPSTNLLEHGRIDLESEMKNMIEFQIVTANNSLMNYRSGMFASTLITHDIISKSYSTRIYNYLDEFGRETHIESGGHPIVNDLPVNKLGKRVSDFPARTFVLPTALTGSNDSQHDTLTGNQPYAAYDPQKWLQRRNSQLIQMENGLNVIILVHGNTDITVGDVVDLNVPFTTSAKSEENDSTDKLYRKSFLIKTIRHEFNLTSAPFKHQMRINLVRDSLDKKLESPDDNFEPESLKSAGVEEYEYDSYP